MDSLPQPGWSEWKRDLVAALFVTVLLSAIFVGCWWLGLKALAAWTTKHVKRAFTALRRGK